jgi:hypothetical protein
MTITIPKSIDLEDYKVQTVELWWQKANLSPTASGYGDKLPTTKMVWFAGRWRRIYCRIYSNVGTCYIIFDGQEIVVS